MEERIDFSSTQLKALLYAIIDRIEYYELMTNAHDCNDCGLLPTCWYAANPGEMVRVNCPLWRPEEG